jgi:hypothetical protein
MIRSSYPTIQAAARRCLIRSSPDATTSKASALSPLLEQASRKISVVPSLACIGNSSSSSISSSSASWTPPELALNPLEQRTALHQEQRRNFVWHAGLLEQQQVHDLETTIQEQMTLLANMISQLPLPATASTSGSDRQGSSSSTASTTAAACLERVEQVLQQEQVILRLCQEYQRLTGEDYEALPRPYCDESSTVLQMMA